MALQVLPILPPKWPYLCHLSKAEHLRLSRGLCDSLLDGVLTSGLASFYLFFSHQADKVIYVSKNQGLTLPTDQNTYNLQSVFMPSPIFRIILFSSTSLKLLTTSFLSHFPRQLQRLELLCIPVLAHDVPVPAGSFLCVHHKANDP